jgi:hypothetical protein
MRTLSRHGHQMDTMSTPWREAIPGKSLRGMAGTTGLEPATSAVTGQRSNQLNYVPRDGGWLVGSGRPTGRPSGL